MAFLLSFFVPGCSMLGIVEQPEYAGHVMATAFSCNLDYRNGPKDAGEFPALVAPYGHVILSRGE